MSINITVHSSHAPSSSGANPFASLDSVRKAENDKLRKARLEQVRQQSKQLAAKVRQNFKTVKQKELANVQKLRETELKNWKQKHIAKLQSDYQHCLEDVGEAHKAAEAAEQCEVWFHEKKAAQQAVALQRGRQAELKQAKENQNREDMKAKRKKEYIPTKSIAVQVSVPTEQKKDVPVQVEDSSAYANTLSAFEQFKKGSKASSVPDLHVRDRPMSPGFSSSDEELLLCTDKNKENISNKQIDTLYYNPTSFTSPETIQQQAFAIKQQPIKPFTQVSEFVKRRREEKTRKYTHPQATVSKENPTYSSQKIVQFDNLSENTLSFPTSTVMDRSILESPRKPVQKLVEVPKAIPIKTQKSPSKQSTSAATGSSLAAPTSKVQYYDFNTKYRKEYDQPSAFVQRNDKPKQGELNAMQEASRLERLQTDMLNARRNLPAGPDRSQVALEKLQIRKDYENLQLELDKLVRAESQVKGLDETSKPLMTEARQRQHSEARQKRMNQAVEDLLKQRVLITCPIVRNPPKEVQLKNRPSQINVAAGKKYAAQFPEDDSNHREVTNSSDSCSTIMLGYDQVGERAGIPLPEEDKVARLKDLLQKVNEQKNLITEELKKEEDIEQELKSSTVKLKSTKSQTDNGIKKLQQRQKELEEQQKHLHEKEKEIHELEKQLKEKLNRLEKEKSKPKVPIIIETKGAASADVQKIVDISSTGSNDSIQSGSDIPVKIVITVNDKLHKKVKKTPKKVLSEARKRKKAKDAVDQPMEPLESPPILPKKVEETLTKQAESHNVHSKPPEPLPKPPEVVQELTEASPISSTTSTIYRQLPPKIDNRVGKLLKELSDSNNQPQKQTKPQRSSYAPKHQLKKTTPLPKPPASQPQRGQHFNPNLMQYIVRLLGMSRQSIEQLGVSSSTSVSTPHDSVVNVSANQSNSVVDEQSRGDQSRMEKLRRFIDENYNFLNEIDETLQDQQLNGTADENISRVEDVWMKTLSRKEQEIRREKSNISGPPVEQSPPVKDSSLKSILKSPKKAPAKVAKIITPQGHVEVIDLDDDREQEVLEKYSHLAENCSKRISELSEMIQKVREEKKKLIENSLSSSEQPESSTKYLDLPRPPQRAPAVQTSPQLARDDPVSEEINNIFTNSRQIGLSKDSGIAMSRPVTSSDYRDSPDNRPPNAGAPQFESSEDLSSREVAAPTISVGFEPLLKDIPKVSAMLPPDELNTQPVAPVVTQELHRDIPLAKRTKPPVAITRYSPQLEEAVAAHELSTIPEVETPLASKTNISVVPSEKLDPSEQILVEVRDKLLEHARALGYENFPNYREYVREQNLEGTRYDPEKTNYTRLHELLETADKSDLRYKNFPVPAPEMNITEESAAINTKKAELESNSSSSTTLPDVVAELKLRKIIDKSFDNSLDDSNLSTPDSGSVEFLHPLPEKSVFKPQQNHTSASETSESLQRDLNQLGLRWASSMLKKNQQAHLQEHSSSSSLSPAEDIRRLSSRKSKPLPSLQADPNESHNTTTGKPLNLREFVARELMIRTHSDLNSLSDSSSPCSMLLRSLLDISHINASTPELLTHTTDKNVQRTSTPVATKSSSAGTKDGSLNVTNGLFSGESRISSVHMSSSSGGEHKLTVPNVRLDVDKYTKGRNNDNQ
ncbi:nucleoprotein TPR-like [Armigeres subalbatus]|uniref:nucleoprotein TPR-like n=1 Tax=Armigeres subalbatus TaxID=124917 RepID=UPI002ED3B372